MKPPSKPSRKIIDIKNDRGNFRRELKFNPPGVGSYNLRGRLDEPSRIPLRGASPVTKICKVSPLSSPSKLASRIGPGSYDITSGVGMITGFNKVARSYQKADFEPITLTENSSRSIISVGVSCEDWCIS